MQIVLLGYMGSGKSTVGKLVAKTLDLPFVDLDDFIEKKERKSIASIFSEKGEVYFRKKESEYLKEVFYQFNDIVLAVGGGTPCYGTNMNSMLEATPNVVYLKVSISELVQRLVSEKSKRPLIQNLSDKELPEFIGKHLFERSFYYEQAPLMVNCDTKSLDEVAAGIEMLLS